MLTAGKNYQLVTNDISCLVLSMVDVIAKSKLCCVNVLFISCFR